MFEAVTDLRSEAARQNHAHAGRKAEKTVSLGTDTDKAMNAALTCARPAKGERARDYHVKEVPGMIVRVTATGCRTFVVRKRGPRPNRETPGRIWDVAIGEVGAITADAAMKRARDLLSEIERGNDPTRKDVGGMTLGDAHKWMLDNSPGIRARTRENYEALWDRHLKKAHALMRMEKITAQWVKDRMNECVSKWEDAAKTKPARGGYEGNKLRQMLGTMFAVWITANGGAGFNPVRAVKKFKCEGHRTNKLTVEQAKKYAAACERYAKGEGGRASDYQKNKLRQTAADFLMLNQFVGLRRSNGLGLRWSWILWDESKIVVPASEHKTGNTNKPHDLKVNVPAPVLAMLKRRYADENRHSVFVFPGRKKDAEGPMNEPGKAHKAVLKLAGLPTDAVSIHDMRRTLGSAMIATGSDITKVRDQLGHANVATTSIYLHLEGETSVADSLEKAASAMFGGEGKA